MTPGSRALGATVHWDPPCRAFVETHAGEVASRCTTGEPLYGSRRAAREPRAGSRCAVRETKRLRCGGRRMDRGERMGVGGADNFFQNQADGWVVVLPILF
jgi:hypothetical protein